MASSVPAVGPRVSAAALIDALGAAPVAAPAAAAAKAEPSAADGASAGPRSVAASESDADDAPAPGESIVARDLRALFDARRSLRPVLQGSSAPVLARSLNAELTCPVCLGIIRDCTAVCECLHRFCAACIEKSLRFGKKECPSCRVTVASRRNLRRDDAFNAVITAIYPDLSLAEQAHDSYIQEVIRSYNVRKFGNIASKGSRQQKDHARKSTKRPASPPPSSGMGAEGSGGAAIMPLAKRARNPNKPEAISFSIVEHPQLSASPLARTYQLRNKFVRTSRYITVLLLKKWLQLKLLAPKPEEAKSEAKSAEAQPAAEATTTKAEEGAITAFPSAAAAAAPQDEQKSAPADAGTKMEDVATPAAAAAAGAASTPAPVRFVLYVRAFDTQLLEPGVASAAGPSGTEMYVPLASDLTLDYIEEHMWDSETRRKARESAALNDALSTASAAGSDLTSLLRKAFRESFVQCATHRKAKQPCTEDCTERIAAWHLYLTTEKEKIDRYTQQQQAKEKEAGATSATAAPAAATSMEAGAAAAGSAAAPAASAANAPSAPPTFITLPTKKRRLVIYYSVVGADGQLLLSAPVMEPQIVERYANREGDDESSDDEQEGTTAAAAPTAQVTTDATAAGQASSTPAQPTQQSSPMQLDEATPAAAAPQ